MEKIEKLITVRKGLHVNIPSNLELTLKFNELAESLNQVIDHLTPKPEKEKWAPEVNDIYWIVDSLGEVQDRYWADDGIDNERLPFGNVFQTEAEAIKARDSIRELLNGRDV